MTHTAWADGNGNSQSARFSNWKGGNWAPLNIAAMVGGFIIFWPLGLAVLAYNRMAQPGDFSRFVDKVKTSRSACGSRPSRRWTHRTSGNVAFDDYRAETLRKLDEERQRLEDEVAEFAAFQEELVRKRDKAAFDGFMKARKPSGRGPA